MKNIVLLLILIFSLHFCRAQKIAGRQSMDTTFLKPSGSNYTEPVWDTNYFSTTQYKLLQQRKREMRAWSKKYKRLQLPGNAIIIDAKTFSTPHGNRTILAWMQQVRVNLNTLENDREEQNEWSYVTNGSGYFDGLLYFTLVDESKLHIINTVRIRHFTSSVNVTGDKVFYDEETIVYPFSINNPLAGKEKSYFGSAYHAIGGTKTKDGTADVLHLFDFNGDGKAYEFALFDQESVPTLSSTLFGYNEKKDSLLWYSWNLARHYKTSSGDSIGMVSESWLDQAISHRFDGKKKIHYSRDLRGRGGSKFEYFLRYDQKNDKYSGDIYITD